MGSVNCDDKVCHWSYKVMESCAIYKPTNNSNCQIPCKLEGCDFDITNGEDCQLWQCTFYQLFHSTQSSATTAVPADYTSPQPPSYKNVLFIIFGVIVGFIALSIVILAVVKKLRISACSFVHTCAATVAAAVCSQSSKRGGFQAFRDEEEEEAV